eukprot:3006461-Pyramimonas_sp.AAC.1
MVRIVSQFTSRVLIRRELLSRLGAVYKFEEMFKGRFARPWSVVRRELRWARALPVFCRRNLGLPSGTALTCIDASSWGFGVAKKKVSMEAVKRLARFDERWSFSRDAEQQQLGPRAAAVWRWRWRARCRPCRGLRGSPRGDLERRLAPRAVGALEAP